jgi:hypothetical protein
VTYDITLTFMISGGTKVPDDRCTAVAVSMHKYAQDMHLICKKICRNMQKYAKNMHMCTGIVQCIWCIIYMHLC